MATLLSFQPLLVWFLVVLLLCANAGLGATGCIARERQALLHFKRGLVDEDGLLSSWGDEKNKSDCCRWRGVHCSKRSGHVVKLHLPAGGYQSLRGKISYSILELEHLTHLDLSHNDFEGTPVSSFLASLTEMQYLNLSFANVGGRLAGPLTNLSNLLSLDLSSNFGLECGNLDWLPHLSSLRHLDLNSVYLSEAVHWPEAINKLPSLIHLNLGGCSLPPLTTSSLSLVNSSAPLTFLDLSCNSDLASSVYPWVFNFRSTLDHLFLWGCGLNVLQGEIGGAFGNMSSLTYLDLSSNQLQGSIPKSFGNMSSLRFLDLSRNQFQGSIPDTIADLASLERLYLEENQLQGIPETVGNMSSFTHLDLSYNQLQSSIPKTVGHMSSLTYLDLSNNQLEGSIPETVGNISSLTHLDLSFNQLEGSIPETVGNMSSLTHLDLSFNQLEGSIPETTGHMSALTYLDLSDNQIRDSIPKAFGNLASLEVLCLYQNKLEGEIPTSFRYLCSLHALKLNNNALSGQLPKDFLSCANETLEELNLFNNKLGGSIPYLIGFSSLIVLSLGFNKMNGTFPKSIGQLTRLEGLDVSSNSLQGTISEAHLFNLSRLWILDLSSNPLTFNISLGWVPPFQLSFIALASSKLGPCFPHWLRNQKGLRNIDISNSEISDVIPNWFWNLNTFVASLNVSNNKIKGTLPNLSLKFKRATFIDMSSNNLESSIPPLPFDLAFLDLSDNNFSGSTSSLCAISNPYLVYLDLSNNSLTGELPKCWSLWKNLVVLNLENNKLSGKIPNSLGSLRSIKTLHLGNNNLMGEVPSSLRNCNSLKLIDLRKNRLFGEVPKWIGGSLPSLIVLNLRSNRFSGSIGSELCQSKKLQIIDLSDNKIGGVIPGCVGNFTAMTRKGSSSITYNYSLSGFPSQSNVDGVLFKLINGFLFRWESQTSSYVNKDLNKWKRSEFEYTSSRTSSYVEKDLIKWKRREFEYKSTLGLVMSIDLSSNMLRGEIPMEVTDLIELVSLNLSRNNLTGSIPASIGKMKSLDILDLSGNRLIGEIPASLSEIYRLSTLDFSNNNLSGMIPRSTQLQSFNTSAFEGNPLLCGQPLLKRCTEDRGNETPVACGHEDNNQRHDSDMGLYICFAFGFIVGFWGVCGTLILNNSWRYSYFQFLCKIKDWLYVTTMISTRRLRRILQS